MFKKTLISLAVASSLGLTGCLSGGDTGANANPDYKINNPAIDGKTWPEFNPLTGDLPLPNDLIFDSEQGDGTFGVTDTSPPVTTALNELSGASTVAPAVIQMNGRIDPASVEVGKTVFVLELEYASGDPLQGLSIGEPPTVAGTANVRADVETLDGLSAIRVLPLEPLDPRKRYLVVVTKGVKDINGDPIIASPTYSHLSDENQVISNGGLQPVRDLINKLWEPTANKALGLSEDQIALTYSFMTSNDEKVLQYIAEPAAWFEDQITTFVRVSGAKKVIGAAQFYSGATLDADTWDLNKDGSVTAADFDLNSDGSITPADFLIDGIDTTFDYNDVKAASDGAIAQFPANLPPSDLGNLFLGGAPCESTTGATAIQCVGVALAANFSPLLPDQSDRSAADITLDPASIKPAALVSALSAGVLDSLGAATDSVLAAQGTMSLPYYLGTTANGVVTSSWKADDTLAKSLNTTFSDIGLKIPQADPTVSTAVNYIFPFPKKTTDVDVPILTLYPSTGSINGVVIYQHGITTDRSAALTFGTALAANGYIVVAIDQPLHGVAAFTAEEQNGLAFKLLQSGIDAGIPLTADQSSADALIAGTLNLGFVMQATSSDATTAQSIIDSVLGGGTSGDANLDAAILFIASAQNTVANAGSTVPGLAPMIGNERHFGLYAVEPGVPGPIDYAAGEGDSGSLFINLTSFLTSRDNIRESAVDQMNLRASLDGLTIARPAANNPTYTIPASLPKYFVGHSLGTITGIPYLAAVNANQTAALDATATDNDITAASLLTPGGGITRLLENSPTFAPTILLGLQNAAGLEQGDANLETYFNVLQGALDTADPINFVDNLSVDGTPILLSEIVGDQVIPNAADDAEWGIPPLNGVYDAEVNGQTVPVMVNSFNAPLAGGEPLTLGLTNITRYNSGNHGTPVSADDATVFGGMVTGTVGLFLSNP
ncbi:hypothetical protein MSNKSG1_02966 [Marinobacter santoriniensis NKSG1]|uniref:Bacterial virulence factor lipase N-terminal domain-containing protein n=1 Tax=Marinobacter santoriniensis NKSG1 TaxID=1288826 RepID=M7CTT3_9GAMM|nr:hypothetical protein [Marinobacter santoriniensis]EMP56986.1 hypothetical protein MSNKSG1_02966 [Marinobacter santoriniensis NKSG1]